MYKRQFLIQEVRKTEHNKLRCASRQTVSDRKWRVHLQTQSPNGKWRRKAEAGQSIMSKCFITDMTFRRQTSRHQIQIELQDSQKSPKTNTKYQANYDSVCGKYFSLPDISIANFSIAVESVFANRFTQNFLHTKSPCWHSG